MEELEITGSDSPEQNVPNDTAPAGPEAEPGESSHQVVVMEAGPPDELLAMMETGDDAGAAASEEDTRLKAVIEALVYVAEDPITVAQMAASLDQSVERIRLLLAELIAEYDKPGRGIQIRDVAGGYRMATKPEHHDAVRAFVKSLKPPLKLSLPALETLSVIAYKQPVTAPEIKEIRGVQGTGVLNTLLDRKLIAEAGRKNVIGKPILYKTTREFLIQFGLKDLSELPTLKEFEEIRRMAMPESDASAPPPAEPGAVQAADAEPVEIETPAVEVDAPPVEAAGPAPEPPPAGPGAVQAADAEPVEIETPAVEVDAPPVEAAGPAPEPPPAGPGAVQAADAEPDEVEAPAVEVEAPPVEAAGPAPKPPEPEG